MLEEIPSRVRGLLEGFIRERLTGETFSNYWGRTHVNGTKATPEQFHIEAQRPGELVTAGKKRGVWPAEGGCFCVKHNFPVDQKAFTPGGGGGRVNLVGVRPSVWGGWPRRARDRQGA